MRALLADDHSIVRMALKHILKDLDPNVQVVEAADADQALKRLNESPVDLAVIDLAMPFADARFIPAAVGAAAPAPVVVFSMNEDPRVAQASISQGAKAFIPKSTSDSLIPNILRLVLAGGIYLPPELAGCGIPPGADGASSGARRALGLPDSAPLSQVSLDSGPALRLDHLTRRQYQVLELLAEGLSNNEIGERLGLNLSTVKSHVTGVLRALNVHSRTQAVLAFKQSEWSPRP